MNNPTVQQQLHPNFKLYGVDMTLAGHYHIYGRAMVDGIQYITTAGVGATLYPVVPGSPNVVTAESTQNYVALDATATRLRLTAYSLDGRQLDSLTLTK